MNPNLKAFQRCDTAAPAHSCLPAQESKLFVASDAPKTIGHPDADLIALGYMFDTIGAKADEASAAFENSVAFNSDLKTMSDSFHAAARNLGGMILDTRATTVEGLKVKARCAKWCDGGLVDDDFDGEFNDGAALASLVRDVLAIGAIDTPAAPAVTFSESGAANHNDAMLCDSAVA